MATNTNTNTTGASNSVASAMATTTAATITTKSTTNVEERLIELINMASIEVDGNKKVEYLYQIKELALNHGLVNNFFQDILAFQNERAPNVKKFILAFIEAACKLDCQLCPKSILSLDLLLNDTNNEIVKRAIQVAAQFYKALVQWIIQSHPCIKVEGGTTTTPTVSSAINTGFIASNNVTTTNTTTNASIMNSTVSGAPTTVTPPGPAGPAQIIADLDNLSSDTEKTWLMWLQIKNSICGFLESTNNEGVRTHCIKFIETIVLMQTPRDKYTDSSHELNLIDPLIKPVKLSPSAVASELVGLPKSGSLFDEEHKLELVEAAKKRFEQIVLFHGTSHISSVNLMAAMQSLVVLAKQRYRFFMGRVIQAMETLNNRLPPTLTESQVQSVRKFLKIQLTVMLKHPYSLDRYQHQITQLLQSVGSKQPEIHKVISDFKSKFGDTSSGNNNVSADASKRIKLEPGIKGSSNTQAAPVGKSKHLDLNKLTQELDEKEKRQIVVDSVKRILNDEKQSHISPAQMEIKKRVLSTLANEFCNTDCPDIIQDYIFSDLRNRHEICYAIIRKNFDVAAAKASKRQINLFDNQELLKNYFDCFNSYLNRAMDLKDSKERDVILPKLYALREEYYTLSNQDQDQDLEQEVEEKL